MDRFNNDPREHRYGKMKSKQLIIKQIIKTKTNVIKQLK